VCEGFVGKDWFGITAQRWRNKSFYFV